MREARERETGLLVAVKEITKLVPDDIADDVRAQVFDEYDLLQRCRVGGVPHRESPPC